DLRACIEEFERRAAEEFARNKYAQAKMQTRTPLGPDTADRLFDALQRLVVEEDKTWQVIDTPLWGKSYQIRQSFVTHPKLELVHLVRWCLLLTRRTKSARGYDSLR